MSAPRVTFLVALATSAAACNLVKLSDDITQAQCDGDADCEVLNERDDPAFDPCVVWQCGASRHCEQGPLDADHDDFSPASVLDDGEAHMCVEDPAAQDCEDGNPDNAPNLPETCDGGDNDCDSFVDEGVLAADARTLVALADGAPAAASYALDATSGAVAIGFAWERDAGKVPALALVGGGLTESASASVLASDALPSARTSRLAVGPLDAGRYVVAFSNEGATRRLVAGLVEGDAPTSLTLDAGLAATGLACAASEACADGVSPTEPGAGLALAASDEHVLVVHARAPAGDPACGDLVGSVDAPRVLANLLLVPSSGAAPVERTSEALVLGRTSAPDADPVVVSLAAVGEGGAALGWLVGYVDAEGRLVFDRVTRDGDAIAVAESGVVAIEDDGGPLSEPASWLSHVEGGDTRLGVAFRRGCPNDTQVLAQLFTLAVDSTAGTVSATALGESVEVGGTRSESGPTIAYHATRASWIVGWLDAGGLRARVLDAGGGLRGTEAYTAIAQGGGVGLLLFPTRAVPLGGWFGVLAAASSADGTFGFDAARFDCDF